MKHLVLDYDAAHAFVEEQIALGGSARWDGWDITFFRATEAAQYSKHGVRRNGRWGYDNRVRPDEKGLWKVDFRNVKKRARARV